MSKILLLIAAALLITSCNNKAKEQTESQESKKQLTALEKRELEIQDSLKKVKVDSLAMIAWGDAKFGMSMKEALNTETFKGGKKLTESKRIAMAYETKRQLNKVFDLRWLGFFWGCFKENELTRIHIESSYVTANHIEDLLRECDIFIKNFTEKYGEPTYKKGKVNISKFNSGEEFEYAKFQIGNKSITITLGEWKLEVKYYYNIYIDNDEFPKKRHVQTEKEKREEQKRIEDAKRIKNNSF